MAWVARARSMSRKRTVAYAVGVAVLVLFLIAGLGFANSVHVTRVTNNARALHWTNATMGTAALTRAGLVQAVTFAELSDNGLVETGDLEFAVDQLLASAEELQQLVEVGAAHESHSTLTDYVAAVGRTLQALGDGEVDAAKNLIVTRVENAYIVLADTLETEQARIQADIEENTDSGRTLNGWVVFALTFAVPGSAIAVYFAVARRQVRAINERNKLELEAERTISKAKDMFIAGLSHELRTPLTSIYGFAEILTDGGVQGREATQQTAKIIANEAAEMTRMVDDLLAASRLESTGVEIELAPTRLQDVIEAAVSPFERAGMTIQREPTATIVITDAARLRHVLVNLLSNAARHGGPGTGIEVLEGDGSVDIEIWDDGPGVASGRVERLFERFAHNGDAPLLTGTVGLGLAVASRLAGLVGGSLRYHRIGAKTYFVATVPAAALATGDPETGANLRVQTPSG